MSLAEIEKAVDALPPEDLAKLAAYIARHDKLTWDKQLEQDFSAEGKHAATLKKVDAEIGEAPKPWGEVKAKLDAQFGFPQPKS